MSKFVYAYIYIYIYIYIHTYERADAYTVAILATRLTKIVEEVVDDRKILLSTNVFHLCRESYEVPECDDDKI